MLFFLLCKLILAHFSSRNLNELHSLSNIPLFARYFILGDKDVLLSIKKKFRIVHIIGESNQKPFHEKNSKNYVHKKFTNEIAALIQNCDLVISRSGAGIINELIETQKPSILIPFPYSKNNHQEKNALLLAESGGSVLMNQKTISKEVFEETLERIFKIKSNLKLRLKNLLTIF